MINETTIVLFLCLCSSVNFVHYKYCTFILHFRSFKCLGRIKWVSDSFLKKLFVHLLEFLRIEVLRESMKSFLFLQHRASSVDSKEIGRPCYSWHWRLESVSWHMSRLCELYNCPLQSSATCCIFRICCLAQEYGSFMVVWINWQQLPFLYFILPVFL